MSDTSEPDTTSTSSSARDGPLSHSTSDTSSTARSGGDGGDNSTDASSLSSDGDFSDADEVAGGDQTREATEVRAGVAELIRAGGNSGGGGGADSSNANEQQSSSGQQQQPGAQQEGHHGPQPYRGPDAVTASSAAAAAAGGADGPDGGAGGAGAGGAGAGGAAGGGGAGDATALAGQLASFFTLQLQDLPAAPASGASGSGAPTAGTPPLVSKSQPSFEEVALFVRRTCAAIVQQQQPLDELAMRRTAASNLFRSLSSASSSSETRSAISSRVTQLIAAAQRSDNDSSLVSNFDFTYNLVSASWPAGGRQIPAAVVESLLQLFVQIDGEVGGDSSSSSSSSSSASPAIAEFYSCPALGNIFDTLLDSLHNANNNNMTAEQRPAAFCLCWRIALVRPNNTAMLLKLHRLALFDSQLATASVAPVASSRAIASLIETSLGAGLPEVPQVLPFDHSAASSSGGGDASSNNSNDQLTAESLPRVIVAWLNPALAEQRNQSSTVLSSPPHSPVTSSPPLADAAAAGAAKICDKCGNACTLCKVRKENPDGSKNYYYCRTCSHFDSFVDGHDPTGGLSDELIAPKICPGCDGICLVVETATGGFKKYHCEQCNLFHGYVGEEMPFLPASDDDEYLEYERAGGGAMSESAPASSLNPDGSPVPPAARLTEAHFPGTASSGPSAGGGDLLAFCFVDGNETDMVFAATHGIARFRDGQLVKENAVSVSNILNMSASEQRDRIFFTYRDGEVAAMRLETLQFVDAECSSGGGDKKHNVALDAFQSASPVLHSEHRARSGGEVIALSGPCIPFWASPEDGRAVAAKVEACLGTGHFNIEFWIGTNTTSGAQMARNADEPFSVFRANDADGAVIVDVTASLRGSGTNALAVKASLFGDAIHATYEQDLRHGQFVHISASVVVSPGAHASWRFRRNARDVAAEAVCLVRNGVVPEGRAAVRNVALLTTTSTRSGPGAGAGAAAGPNSLNASVSSIGVWGNGPRSAEDVELSARFGVPNEREAISANGLALWVNADASTGDGVPMRRFFDRVTGATMRLPASTTVTMEPFGGADKKIRHLPYAARRRRMHYAALGSTATMLRFAGGSSAIVDSTSFCVFEATGRLVSEKMAAPWFADAGGGSGMARRRIVASNERSSRVYAIDVATLVMASAPVNTTPLPVLDAENATAADLSGAVMAAQRRLMQSAAPAPGQLPAVRVPFAVAGDNSMIQLLKSIIAGDGAQQTRTSPEFCRFALHSLLLHVRVLGRNIDSDLSAELHQLMESADFSFDEQSAALASKLRQVIFAECCDEIAQVQVLVEGTNAELCSALLEPSRFAVLANSLFAAGEERSRSFLEKMRRDAETEGDAVLDAAASRRATGATAGAGGAAAATTTATAQSPIWISIIVAATRQRIAGGSCPAGVLAVRTLFRAGAEIIKKAMKLLDENKISLNDVDRSLRKTIVTGAVFPVVFAFEELLGSRVQDSLDDVSELLENFGKLTAKFDAEQRKTGGGGGNNNTNDEAAAGGGAASSAPTNPPASHHRSPTSTESAPTETKTTVVTRDEVIHANNASLIIVDPPSSPSPQYGTAVHVRFVSDATGDVSSHVIQVGASEGVRKRGGHTVTINIIGANPNAIRAPGATGLECVVRTTLSQERPRVGGVSSALYPSASARAGGNQWLFSMHAALSDAVLEVAAKFPFHMDTDVSFADADDDEEDDLIAGGAAAAAAETGSARGASDSPASSPLASGPTGNSSFAAAGGGASSGGGQQHDDAVTTSIPSILRGGLRSQNPEQTTEDLAGFDTETIQSIKADPTPTTCEQEVIDSVFERYKTQPAMTRGKDVIVLCMRALAWHLPRSLDNGTWRESLAWAAERIRKSLGLATQTLMLASQRESATAFATFVLLELTPVRRARFLSSSTEEAFTKSNSVEGFGTDDMETHGLRHADPNGGGMARTATGGGATPSTRTSIRMAGYHRTRARRNVRIIAQKIVSDEQKEEGKLFSALFDPTKRPDAAACSELMKKRTQMAEDLAVHAERCQTVLRTVASADTPAMRRSLEFLRNIFDSTQATRWVVTSGGAGGSSSAEKRRKPIIENRETRTNWTASLRGCSLASEERARSAIFALFRSVLDRAVEIIKREQGPSILLAPSYVSKTHDTAWMIASITSILTHAFSGCDMRKIEVRTLQAFGNLTGCYSDDNTPADAVPVLKEDTPEMSNFRGCLRAAVLNFEHRVSVVVDNKFELGGLSPQNIAITHNEGLCGVQVEDTEATVYAKEVWALKGKAASNEPEVYYFETVIEMMPGEARNIMANADDVRNSTTSRGLEGVVGAEQYWMGLASVKTSKGKLKTDFAPQFFAYGGSGLVVCKSGSSSSSSSSSGGGGGGNAEPLYLPPFSTNDTVGMGIIVDTKQVFFTFNGHFLGFWSEPISGDVMIPMVGGRASGGLLKISSNFGTTSHFRYPFPAAYRFMATKRAHLGPTCGLQLSTLSLHSIFSRCAWGALSLEALTSQDIDDRDKFIEDDDTRADQANFLEHVAQLLNDVFGRIIFATTTGDDHKPMRGEVLSVVYWPAIMAALQSLMASFGSPLSTPQTHWNVLNAVEQAFALPSTFPSLQTNGCILLHQFFAKSGLRTEGITQAARLQAGGDAMQGSLVNALLKMTNVRAEQDDLDAAANADGSGGGKKKKQPKFEPVWSGPKLDDAEPHKARGAGMIFSDSQIPLTGVTTFSCRTSRGRNPGQSLAGCYYIGVRHNDGSDVPAAITGRQVKEHPCLFVIQDVDDSDNMPNYRLHRNTQGNSEGRIYSDMDLTTFTIDRDANTLSFTRTPATRDPEQQAEPQELGVIFDLPPGASLSPVGFLCNDDATCWFESAAGAGASADGAGGKASDAVAFPYLLRQSWACDCLQRLLTHPHWAAAISQPLIDRMRQELSDRVDGSITAKDDIGGGDENDDEENDEDGKKPPYKSYMELAFKILGGQYSYTRCFNGEHLLEYDVLSADNEQALLADSTDGILQRVPCKNLLPTPSPLAIMMDSTSHAVWRPSSAAGAGGAGGADAGGSLMSVSSAGGGDAGGGAASSLTSAGGDSATGGVGGDEIQVASGALDVLVEAARSIDHLVTQVSLVQPLLSAEIAARRVIERHAEAAMKGISARILRSSHARERALTFVPARHYGPVFTTSGDDVCGDVFFPNPRVVTGATSEEATSSGRRGRGKTARAPIALDRSAADFCVGVLVNMQSGNAGTVKLSCGAKSVQLSPSGYEPRSVFWAWFHLREAGGELESIRIFQQVLGGNGSSTVNDLTAAAGGNLTQLTDELRRAAAADLQSTGVCSRAFFDVKLLDEHEVMVSVGNAEPHLGVTPSTLPVLPPRSLYSLHGDKDGLFSENPGRALPSGAASTCKWNSAVSIDRSNFLRPVQSDASTVNRILCPQSFLEWAFPKVVYCEASKQQFRRAVSAFPPKRLRPDDSVAVDLSTPLLFNDDNHYGTLRSAKCNYSRVAAAASSVVQLGPLVHEEPSRVSFKVSHPALSIGQPFTALLSGDAAMCHNAACRAACSWQQAAGGAAAAPAATVAGGGAASGGGGGAGGGQQSKANVITLDNVDDIVQASAPLPVGPAGTRGRSTKCLVTLRVTPPKNGRRWAIGLCDPSQYKNNDKIKFTPDTELHSGNKLGSAGEVTFHVLIDCEAKAIFASKCLSNLSPVPNVQPFVTDLNEDAVRRGLTLWCESHKEEATTFTIVDVMTAPDAAAASDAAGSAGLTIALTNSKAMRFGSSSSIADGVSAGIALRAERRPQQQGGDAAGMSLVITNELAGDMTTKNLFVPSANLCSGDVVTVEWLPFNGGVATASQQQPAAGGGAASGGGAGNNNNNYATLSFYINNTALCSHTGPVEQFPLPLSDASDISVMCGSATAVTLVHDPICESVAAGAKIVQVLNEDTALVVFEDASSSASARQTGLRGATDPFVVHRLNLRFTSAFGNINPEEDRLEAHRARVGRLDSNNRLERGTFVSFVAGKVSAEWDSAEAPKPGAKPKLESADLKHVFSIKNEDAADGGSRGQPLPVIEPLAAKVMQPNQQYVCGSQKCTGRTVPSNSYNGIMWDMEAKATLKFTKINWFSEHDGTQRFRVFWKRGTHIDHETVDGDWTQIFNGEKRVYSGERLNEIVFDTAITIGSGERFALFIHCVNNCGVRYWTPDEAHETGGCTYERVFEETPHVKLWWGSKTTSGTPFSSVSREARAFAGTLNFDVDSSFVPPMLAAVAAPFTSACSSSAASSITAFQTSVASSGAQLRTVNSWSQRDGVATATQMQACITPAKGFAAHVHSVDVLTRRNQNAAAAASSSSSAAPSSTHVRAFISNTSTSFGQWILNCRLPIDEAGALSIPLNVNVLEECYVTIALNEGGPIALEVPANPKEVIGRVGGAGGSEEEAAAAASSAAAGSSAADFFAVSGFRGSLNAAPLGGSGGGGAGKPGEPEQWDCGVGRYGQSGSYSYNGIMFDIEPKTDMILNEIFCIPETTSSGVRFTGWYREGSLREEARNPNAWTRIHSSVQRDIRNGEHYSIGEWNMTLRAGEKYAFFINASHNCAVRFYTNNDAMRCAVGELLDENDDFIIYCGRKSENSEPFTSISTDPRGFRGRIKYQPIVKVAAAAAGGGADVSSSDGPRSVGMTGVVMRLVTTALSTILSYVRSGAPQVLERVAPVVAESSMLLASAAMSMSAPDAKSVKIFGQLFQSLDAMPLATLLRIWTNEGKKKKNKAAAKKQSAGAADDDRCPADLVTEFELGEEQNLVSKLTAAGIFSSTPFDELTEFDHESDPASPTSPTRGFASDSHNAITLGAAHPLLLCEECHKPFNTPECVSVDAAGGDNDDGGGAAAGGGAHSGSSRCTHHTLSASAVESARRRLQALLRLALPDTDEANARTLAERIVRGEVDPSSLADGGGTAMAAAAASSSAAAGGAAASSSGPASSPPGGAADDTMGGMGTPSSSVNAADLVASQGVDRPVRVTTPAADPASPAAAEVELQVATAALSVDVATGSPLGAPGCRQVSEQFAAANSLWTAVFEVGTDLLVYISLRCETPMKMTATPANRATLDYDVSVTVAMPGAGASPRATEGRVVLAPGGSTFFSLGHLLSLSDLRAFENSSSSSATAGSSPSTFACRIRFGQKTGNEPFRRPALVVQQQNESEVPSVIPGPPRPATRHSATELVDVCMATDQLAPPSVYSVSLPCRFTPVQRSWERATRPSESAASHHHCVLLHDAADSGSGSSRANNCGATLHVMRRDQVDLTRGWYAPELQEAPPHPCLVQVLQGPLETSGGSRDDSAAISVVTNRCDMNLYDFCRQNAAVAGSKPFAALVVYSLLCAIEHLNNNSITHGAIHPFNVYVSPDPDQPSSSKYSIKLWNTAKLPPIHLFTPPEKLMSFDHCDAADIWSVACIRIMLANNNSNFVPPFARGGSSDPSGFYAVGNPMSILERAVQSTGVDFVHSAIGSMMRRFVEPSPYMYCRSMPDVNPTAKAQQLVDPGAGSVSGGLNAARDVAELLQLSPDHRMKPREAFRDLTMLRDAAPRQETEAKTFEALAEEERTSYNGCMFNIIAKDSPIEITEFGIRAETESREAEYKIWWRKGSIEGHETNDAGWIVNGEGRCTAGHRITGACRLATPIKVAPGETIGVYINSPYNCHVLYRTGWRQERSYSTKAEDSNLRLTLGRSSHSSTPFSSIPADRVLFWGTISYKTVSLDPRRSKVQRLENQERVPEVWDILPGTRAVHAGRRCIVVDSLRDDSQGLKNADNMPQVWCRVVYESTADGSSSSSAGGGAAASSSYTFSTADTCSLLSTKPEWVCMDEDFELICGPVAALPNWVRQAFVPATPVHSGIGGCGCNNAINPTMRAFSTELSVPVTMQNFVKLSWQQQQQQQEAGGGAAAAAGAGGAGAERTPNFGGDDSAAVVEAPSQATGDVGAATAVVDVVKCAGSGFLAAPFAAPGKWEATVRVNFTSSERNRDAPLAEQSCVVALCFGDPYRSEAFRNIRTADDLDAFFESTDGCNGMGAFLTDTCGVRVRYDALRGIASFGLQQRRSDKEEEALCFLPPQLVSTSNPAEGGGASSTASNAPYLVFLNPHRIATAQIVRCIVECPKTNSLVLPKADDAAYTYAVQAPLSMVESMAGFSCPVLLGWNINITRTKSELVAKRSGKLQQQQANGATAAIEQQQQRSDIAIHLTQANHDLFEQKPTVTLLNSTSLIAPGRALRFSSSAPAGTGTFVRAEVVASDHVFQNHDGEPELRLVIRFPRPTNALSIVSSASPGAGDLSSAVTPFSVVDPWKTFSVFNTEARAPQITLQAAHKPGTFRGAGPLCLHTMVFAFVGAPAPAADATTFGASKDMKDKITSDMIGRAIRAAEIGQPVVLDHTNLRYRSSESRRVSYHVVRVDERLNAVEFVEDSSYVVVGNVPAPTSAVDIPLRGGARGSQLRLLSWDVAPCATMTRPNRRLKKVVAAGKSADGTGAAVAASADEDASETAKALNALKKACEVLGVSEDFAAHFAKYTPGAIVVRHTQKQPAGGGGAIVMPSSITSCTQAVNLRLIELARESIFELCKRGVLRNQVPMRVISLLSCAGESRARELLRSADATTASSLFSVAMASMKFYVLALPNRVRLAILGLLEEVLHNESMRSLRDVITSAPVCIDVIYALIRTSLVTSGAPRRSAVHCLSLLFDTIRDQNALPVATVKVWLKPLFTMLIAFFKKSRTSQLGMLALELAVSVYRCQRRLHLSVGLAPPSTSLPYRDMAGVLDLAAALDPSVAHQRGEELPNVLKVSAAVAGFVWDRMPSANADADFSATLNIKEAAADAGFPRGQGHLDTAPVFGQQLRGVLPQRKLEMNRFLSMRLNPAVLAATGANSRAGAAGGGADSGAPRWLLTIGVACKDTVHGSVTFTAIPNDPNPHTQTDSSGWMVVPEYSRGFERRDLPADDADLQIPSGHPDKAIDICFGKFASNKCFFSFRFQREIQVMLVELDRTADSAETLASLNDLRLVVSCPTEHVDAAVSIIAHSDCEVKNADWATESRARHALADMDMSLKEVYTIANDLTEEQARWLTRASVPDFDVQTILTFVEALGDECGEAKTTPTVIKKKIDTIPTDARQCRWRMEKTQIENNAHAVGHREYLRECDKLTQKRGERFMRENPFFIVEALARVAITIDEYADYLFQYIDLKNPHSVSCKAWRKLKLFMLQASRDKVREAVMRDFRGSTNHSRRQIEIAQLDAAPSRRRDALQTLQHSIFGQVFKGMTRQSLIQPGRERDMFLLSPLFQAQFPGFGSIDAGGPYRDTLQGIANELGNEHVHGDFHMNPLFTSAENNMVMPDPFCLRIDACVGPMLQFFGMLLANFLTSKDVLAADLPPFFWKFLVEDALTLHDLSLVNQPSYQRLSLDNFIDATLEELEDDFPGLGARLRNRGIRHFPSEGTSDRALLSRVLEVACELELHRYDDVMHTIAAGLHKIIPAEALRALHWRDLRDEVCGKPQASVEDFKSAVSNEGLDSQTLNMFYRVIERFNYHERSLLLAFATGQRRFPLARPLKVKKLSGSNRLPEGHTCFFQIDLSNYSNEDIMYERILLGITECTTTDLDGGGGGDVVAAEF